MIAPHFCMVQFVRAILPAGWHHPQGLRFGFDRPCGHRQRHRVSREMPWRFFPPKSPNLKEFPGELRLGMGRKSRNL